MEILVISGLSGAGKSCAASCLEDIGYYTVDNMPAAIIPKFAEFSAESDGRYDRVALVNDIRWRSSTVCARAARSAACSIWRRTRRASSSATRKRDAATHSWRAARPSRMR